MERLRGEASKKGTLQPFLPELLSSLPSKKSLQSPLQELLNSPPTPKSPLPVRHEPLNCPPSRKVPHPSVLHLCLVPCRLWTLPLKKEHLKNEATPQLEGYLGAMHYGVTGIINPGTMKRQQWMKRWTCPPPPPLSGTMPLIGPPYTMMTWIRCPLIPWEGTPLA